MVGFEIWKPYIIKYFESFYLPFKNPNNIFTGTEERKSEQANISYAPSLLDHAKHNEWTL